MPEPRIRIGHTAAPSLLSRAIRGVTAQPVSHSFLSYWSRDYGLEYILEAEEGRGVVGKPAFRRLAYLQESLAVVHELLLEPAEEDRLLHEVARASAGQGYDWGLNLQLLFVSLGNRLVRRRRWAPRWTGGQRFNCSEAIICGLRAAALLAPPERGTPGDLCAALDGWPRARRGDVGGYLARLQGLPGVRMAS